MITKELLFNYNNNFKDIYNLAIEDNDEFIKVIPEIVLYEKGVWFEIEDSDCVYRKDKVWIDIADIPYELRLIIDMIRDKNGYIGLKITIKKIIENDNLINIKVKIKINGFLGRIIEKFITIITNINIINIDNVKTDVKINYEIRSKFPNDLNDMIDNHIENKLQNYYIKKIDDFFKNI